MERIELSRGAEECEDKNHPRDGAGVTAIIEVVAFRDALLLARTEQREQRLAHAHGVAQLHIGVDLLLVNAPPFFTRQRRNAFCFVRREEVVNAVADQSED